MDTGEILSTVEDLVALAPRATGSAGGHAAADYVAHRFDAAGLDQVHFLEVPSWSWQATRCRLRVAEQGLECSPILHSGLDSEEAHGVLVDEPVRARVVDVGSGDVKSHDVSGRIVLFDLTFLMSTAHLLPFTEYVHDPGRRMLRREVLGARNPYVTNLTQVMAAARAGGAAAVIGVLRDYPDSHRYHNELYRRHLMELPGVWITRSQGESLRAQLAADPDLVAEVDLRIEREPVTSRTVIGRLPGTSPETVMIQSHHDSVGLGAVEDATGTAEVIALAEHFAALAQREGPRTKTLLFVTFDTHFTGYQAHREFARQWVLEPQHDLDLVLNLTIEHVGLRAVVGADGGFEVTDDPEPRGIFENLSPALKLQMVRGIRRHGLGSTSLLNAALLEWGRLGIPTDASFMLLSGVPVASLVSGPLYLYDDADGLDMVDVDSLLPVARFFADLVEAVDRRPGSRLGLVPRALRRRLPRGRW